MTATLDSGRRPADRPISPSTTPAAAATRAPLAGRLAGLDGLRALAVIAVVVFHLGDTLLPGGFLGVDVFFVISGFLITRNLLTEVVATGGVDLRRFFVRRWRRLYPAMAVLIAFVAAAALIWRDELATLPGSVLSSLGYSTNWWLIFHHESYFVSTGRPPMLQHLWSLAIEEQYYVGWALLVAAIAGSRWLGRRSVQARIGGVAGTAALLAIASTIAMAWIAITTDVPYRADSSRVYFGTDTHSMGLMLGSAAGALFVLLAQRPRLRERPRFLMVTDLGAVLVLAVLVDKFRTLNEFVPGLYRGGFLAIDALALLVILAVVRPGSRLGAALDIAPLQWIGLRSYSIYLWHWPVFVVTRPGIDVSGPTWLIDLARVGLVLVLAEASYRLVELPLRSRVARRRSTHAAPRGNGVRLAIGAGIALACIATLFIGTANHRAAQALPPTTTPANGTVPAVVPAAPAAPPAVAAAANRPAPSHRPAQVVRPKVNLHPTVSAFGDSVLLGAGPALQALDPNVHVDAVEGRQAYDTLDDVTADLKAGRIGSVVVIHTGNNGVIDPSQLSSTIKALGDRRVVLLTDRVPREWEAPNNQIIERVGKQFPNVDVLDWHSLSAPHPSWFYSDGLHLNPTGAAGYARLVMNAVTS